MRGRRDDVTKLKRLRVFLRGDQPGDVRHVHHQKRAALVRDFSEPGVVPVSWVRAAAANQHLGAVVKRRFFELVVIDQTGVRVDFVGKGLEENGRGAYFFTPRGVVPVFVNEVSVGRTVGISGIGMSKQSC